MWFRSNNSVVLQIVFQFYLAAKFDMYSVEYIPKSKSKNKRIFFFLQQDQITVKCVTIEVLT